MFIFIQSTRVKRKVGNEFGANLGHIYGTYSRHLVFRLIVWLNGINCTGRCAVCTGWFTCTFYPVFHNGSDPVSFGEQNNGFCLFWSSSRVNIALAHDQKATFVKLVFYTINQSSLMLNVKVGKSEHQPARKIANLSDQLGLDWLIDWLKTNSEKSIF